MKRTNPFGGSTSGPGGSGGFSAFSSSSTTLSYIAPPPDLSSLPQQIVVPFKNLSKKDSITKAKALDELLSYVRSQAELEDSLLEAWTQMYARVSIDNSRTVRESSHILLLELLKTAGKRMEKRIPHFVGPWLAGTFDRDRAVSRAATNGLSQFLDTEEKQNKFWTRCQAQILNFATEAAKETPDTLSDERSSTKEDSLAKYYRVMAASLSLVLNLITKVEADVINDGVGRYLKVDAVWSMAAAEDSFVRKTLFRLLETILDRDATLLRPQLKQVGRILVSDSIKIAQTGSADDLVRALTKLSRSYPEVWGTKTHPLERLRSFVEKGSQGSSSEYWKNLGFLLEALPEKPGSASMASTFLKSLRSGITNRQEPRGNPQAWQTYMSAFERFLKTVPVDAGFLQDAFYPLVRQYLHPSPDLQTWASPAKITLSPRIWRTLAGHPDPAVQATVPEEWQKLQQAFLSRITVSLPAVLQDFPKSQHSVASEGQHWFGLAGAILTELEQATETSAEEQILKKTITESSSAILRGSLELLIRRNYNPFGAASVIQAAFERTPGLCEEDSFVADLFPHRDAEKLGVLVGSPSLPYLVSCLDALSSTRPGDFPSIWEALIDSALRSTPEISVAATKELIRLPACAQIAQNHVRLQAFLASTWLACAEGDGTTAWWDLCESTLKFGALTDGSLTAIIVDIVRELDVSDSSGPALRALELITHEKPALVSQHRTAHVDLVTKLLALTELNNSEVSGQAASLQAHLEEKVTGQSPLVKIIQNNLEDAGPSSLGLDVLIQRATNVFKAGSVAIEELFPSSNKWLNELTPLLQTRPNTSLSLTSSLGGAYFLAKGSDANRNSPRRDQKGRSIPARMAVYTSKLLTCGLSLASLPKEFHLELIYLLSLTGELAGDQLAMMEDGGLWAAVDDEDDAASEIQDFIALSHSIINDIAAEATSWRDNSSSGSSVAERLVDFALQHTRDLSVTSLYSSKFLSTLLLALVGAHGTPTRLDEYLGTLGVMKVSQETVFAATAFLVGFGETLSCSEAVKTLCNRLVSELMGAMPGSPKTLYTLVLFNSCISVYEAGRVPVDARKQTLALRQMTSWMDSAEEMEPGLAAEACKAILRILPSVKDIYGPYWEQAISFCIHLWTERASHDPASARLPYIYNSLKLVAALMDAPDASDDLTEAVAQSSHDISTAMIGLLKLPSGRSELNQIVESLLGRMLERVPLSHITDLSDLYGSVAAESREIQTAAFGLLHRALPAAQEQLSVDVLLEKNVASLPDELLSLLLEAPTLEKYPDELLVQFPPSIRSYLLAWHLIFDAYSKASYKLQNDYSESLKTQKFVGPFLDFMFDVLGHSAGHPLNLEKEDFTPDMIRSYDIKIAGTEGNERNLNWLLLHLLFLTMKHIPGLFRTWNLECRNKQIRVTLAPWLVRYFSPLIIADALDEVAHWAETQEPPADDEKQLEVKVSRPTREVTAGYEIDEDEASIAIRIPPAYPLETCEVVGVKRVAVSEEKWKSWLMSAQGVIRFGNGGIIDGLTTFQRNIVGSLKGQTECAICYSIVSSDKRLPDKECGTCHHSYHRICLYKWFQNSGRNSCPLCRNPIEYLGADSQRRKKVVY